MVDEPTRATSSALLALANGARLWRQTYANRGSKSSEVSFDERNQELDARTASQSTGAPTGELASRQSDETSVERANRHNQLARRTWHESQQEERNRELEVGEEASRSKWPPRDESEDEHSNLGAASRLTGSQSKQVNLSSLQSASSEQKSRLLLLTTRSVDRLPSFGGVAATTDRATDRGQPEVDCSNQRKIGESCESSKCFVRHSPVARQEVNDIGLRLPVKQATTSSASCSSQASSGVSLVGARRPFITTLVPSGGARGGRGDRPEVGVAERRAATGGARTKWPLGYSNISNLFPEVRRASHLSPPEVRLHTDGGTFRRSREDDHKYSHSHRDSHRDRHEDKELRATSGAGSRGRGQATDRRPQRWASVQELARRGGGGGVAAAAVGGGQSGGELPRPRNRSLGGLGGERSPQQQQPAGARHASQRHPSASSIATSGYNSAMGAARRANYVEPGGRDSARWAAASASVGVATRSPTGSSSASPRYGSAGASPHHGEAHSSAGATPDECLVHVGVATPDGGRGSSATHTQARAYYDSASPFSVYSRAGAARLAAPGEQLRRIMGTATPPTLPLPRPIYLHPQWAYSRPFIHLRPTTTSNANANYQRDTDDDDDHELALIDATPKMATQMGVATGSGPEFAPFSKLRDAQAIRALDFHPSGEVYAVGSNSRALRICAYPAEQELRNFRPQNRPPIAPRVLFKFLQVHRGSIYCVAFSRSGHLLATGSNDQSVHLVRYNSHTHSPDGDEFRLTMHDGTIRDLCFIEDHLGGSSILLSAGGGDNKIYVTDCDTVTPYQSMGGHSQQVMALRHLAGAQFVSASLDRTIRFWDLRTRHCTSIISAPPTHTTNNNNKTSGSSNTRAQHSAGPGAPVCSLALDPSARLLTSGHADSTCMLYDVRGSKVIQSFRPHDDEIRTVAFSPKSYYLLTGAYDGRLVLTDLQGDLTQHLPSVCVAECGDKIVQAKWHPGDFTFVSASADKSATLWALPAL